MNTKPKSPSAGTPFSLATWILSRAVSKVFWPHEDKHTQERRLDSLKRHLPILVTPLSFGLIMACLWLGISTLGIHFDKSAEGILTAGIIPTVGIIYVIFAALILSMVV